ncbi:EF-hand calcium-binding domain-containing protein 10 [Diachasma alloeum]|uniref:EF-hand calcium-binding domain-containing protein 10 n=1 Tax=Diachasma alloeum TaxID=454923 RepID=UPI00073820F3|nr:EF-hand calcium-binding domain-containing protein 10 [Diachasma alloeum]
MSSTDDIRKSGKKSKAPTEGLNYTSDSDRTETTDSAGRCIHQSGTHEQAERYLTDHKIYELFNFLIGHLLVDEPDDPIEYLDTLLNKCMLFKSDMDEPPLLFTSRHIGSLFQSMNPSGSGTITLEQYRSGMKSLGITNYNQRPVECTPGHVDQQTFQDEAKKCLIQSLAEMVGKCD